MSKKFNLLLRECVDPALLWKDIEANIGSFSTDTVFDGGLTIPKLVGPKETEENWIIKGCEVFTSSIRKIRNALSHGKDVETSGVIMPTVRNMRILLPWVHIMATAAGEVVLYKDRL